MNAVISPDLTAKLAKLCGMFDSDHHGERAKAAAAADRLVKGNGLTWRDVFGGPKRECRVWTDPTDADEAIRICLEWRDALSQWDIQFLASLAAWDGRLTAKQIGVLYRLVTKCRTYAEASE